MACLLVARSSSYALTTALGVNQPCLTLLAATDRDLLSLLDAHLVRVTDSPPSRGFRAFGVGSGVVAGLGAASAPQPAEVVA